MVRVNHSVRVTMAAMFALIVPFAPALAASEFAGTWKVTDGNGKDFEIVLTQGGEASADRSGEPLKGTWSEQDGAAVIKWDSGWTTKIAKDGSGFVKSAFEQGKAVPKEGASSPAERVK